MPQVLRLALIPDPGLCQVLVDCRDDPFDLILLLGFIKYPSMASSLRLGGLRADRAAAALVLRRGLRSSAALSVTDIQFYRQVDMSHLHLKEAQSTRRKFELKLKERTMAAERERERQVEAAAAAGSIQQEQETESPPVSLPQYVERGPSEVLRAITAGIARDPTAPDHRFHDDPYLIPYNSLRKRDYIMSKEGGRRSARYILDKHPELFEKNLIEMEPPIKAFMPRLMYSEKKASEEMLRVFLAGHNVKDSVKVYRALEKRGEKVGAETRQALLEVLCFHNEEEAIEEDFNLISGVTEWREEAVQWKVGGLAEEIYAEEPTPQARSALLCAMAKYSKFERGWELYQECKAAGDPLDVEALNAAIRCVSVKGGFVLGWQEVTAILNRMKDSGAGPDHGTVLACLKWLVPFRQQDHALACEKSLAVLSEFKSAGVPVSLAAYKAVANVFCKRGKSNEMAHHIMAAVANQDWSEQTGVVDQDDTYFFYSMMGIATSTDSLSLAYKLRDLLAVGGNHVFLSDYGHSYRFHHGLLSLMLRHEPIDVFMKTYERLVPHEFSPTSDLAMKVLQEARGQGSPGHAVRLWTDLQDSRFYAAGLNKRLEVMKGFLSEVQKVDAFDAGSPHAHLSEALIQIAREASDKVTKGKIRTSKFRAPVASSPDEARVLDSALLIVLRGGATMADVPAAAEGEGEEEGQEDSPPAGWKEADWRLAVGIVDHCLREAGEMAGHLSEEAVTLFVEEALAEGDAEAAVKGALYAGEAALACGPRLAEAVAETVKLEEADRKKMNSLFSHDAKWTMLN